MIMSKAMDTKALFHKLKPFLAVVFLQFGLAGMDILCKAALNKCMSNYVLVVCRHASMDDEHAITLQAYPAELSPMAWICFLGTVEGAVVALVMERGNAVVWSIQWDTKLLAAVYSGIVCSGVAYCIQGVVMKDRGPVFVTAFIPLCMVIVAVLSTFILAEQLFLGRVVGAIVIVAPWVNRLCRQYFLLVYWRRRRRIVLAFAPHDKGIVCSGVAYCIQGVVMKDRGPVFVTAFIPLCMVIVAVLSTFILAEQLFLGRVVGTIVIVAGLYLAVWGKSKDYTSSSLPIDEQKALPTKSVDLGGNGKENFSHEMIKISASNDNETPDTNGD